MITVVVKIMRMFLISPKPCTKKIEFLQVTCRTGMKIHVVNRV